MVSQPVRLPSTTELPCSDDTPVDNVGPWTSRSEDQNLLPNLLLFVLMSLWAERRDWYFGVDMAIYHTTGVSPKVPVVPDGFLSLGVERRRASADNESETKGRLSYALWEESGVAPVIVLEMVSKTPGDEYDEKLEIYQRLGVLYYVVCNSNYWQRDRHLPFEVYKLDNGTYQLQTGELYWMPEVGLGIGRTRKSLGGAEGIELEMLMWHDEQGTPYPLPEEAMQRLQQQLELERRQTQAQRQRAETERQRAETERQRAESAEQQIEAERQRAEMERQQKARLAEYLRSLGIDPDNLPSDK